MAEIKTERDVETASAEQREHWAHEDIKRFFSKFGPEGEKAAEKLINWSKEFHDRVSGFVSAGIPVSDLPGLTTHVGLNSETTELAIIQRGKRSGRLPGGNLVHLNSLEPVKIKKAVAGEKGIVFIKEKGGAVIVFKSGMVAQADDLLIGDFMGHLRQAGLDVEELFGRL